MAGMWKNLRRYAVIGVLVLMVNLIAFSVVAWNINRKLKSELSDAEMIDLMGFVNTIITHIANGNKNEERLVNVMGGTIIETESEKWMRQGMERGVQQGQAKMLIELGQEDGLDDTTILQRIQERIGLSLEEAMAYMKQYGKRLV